MVQEDMCIMGILKSTESQDFDFTELHISHN